MAKKMLAYISHGHIKGEDSGAVSGKFVEVELNRKVAQACYNYLVKKSLRDYKVAYPEQKSGGWHLIKENLKVKAYSKIYRVVSVDIHFNACGGDGMEVYCKDTKYSKELGDLICKEFKKIGQNYHGNPIKGENDLQFLKNIGTSVLVECGYVDNKTDRKGFDTDKELKKYGEAIAKALIKYLKKYK